MTDIDALLKNKHTPGPWQVSGGRNRPDIYGHMVGPDGIGIACVAYSDRTNADHVASLADARLIAAAPDLLDALNAERAKVAALEAEADGMAEAFNTLVTHLDSCPRFERGAGGMSIEAQVRRSFLRDVRAIWAEDARLALEAYQQVRGE